MDAILQILAGAVERSAWLAPLIALLAGVLTSFTPCSLSSLPLIVGVMGGTGERDVKRALRLSLTFAAGSAVTLTALGVAASLLGKLVSGASSWWYFLLGVLMVLMALQTWEIFTFIPSTYLTAKTKRRGYVGALLAGILAGVFSSPCSTPMLVALLAIVAGGGGIWWGALLLMMYSVGYSVLSVAAGTSVGLVQRITGSKGYGKWSMALKIVMGCLILAIGLYMFYQAF